MNQLTFILVFFSLTSFGQTSLQKTEFSISCLNYQDSIKERPLVEDWIKKDADRIESIFNKIPEYGSTLDSLTLVLPNLLNGKGNASLAKHVLGSDLELLEYTLYGGYGSLRFEILYSNGKVLRINQYISNHAEIIESRFLELIKVPLICDYGYAENQTFYSKNISKYKNLHPNFYLDTLVKAEKDSGQKALNFFSNYSALRQYLQSPMHAMDSYWEPAIRHVVYLIQNKRIDILEKLLYSPLPSGRVFAASALNYLKDNDEYKFDEITYSRITEIKNQGTTFTSGILSCWISKFEYDYYDVYNDFEELIK